MAEISVVSGQVVSIVVLGPRYEFEKKRTEEPKKKKKKVKRRKKKKRKKG